MLFRKAAPAIGDADWRFVLRRFALVGALDEPRRARLRALAARFLAAKAIEPVQGLALDPAQRAAIAALACVPVLELGLDAYDGWRSVVVYPAGFLARGQDVDEAGVVHEYAEPRSGETWLAGPVVLSWEEVAMSGDLDGYNVVVHEMAHKLDMLDGDANGRPPLHTGMDPVRWYEAFSTAFADLEACLDAGREPPIDDYAAQSPDEFFAVASEYFFELPEVLAAAYPEVYEQLDAFYRPQPGP